MLPQGDKPKRRVSQAPIKFTTCFAGCGATVEYRTNPLVSCVACRLEAKRARARKTANAKRRARGIAPVKGTSSKCIDCGAPITRANIAHVRCKECAYQQDLKHSRATSRRRGTDAQRRENYNAWMRQRRMVDPAWRVSAHLRVLMHRALKGRKQGRSWRAFVPYSLEELMQHLERQFLPGMTWENQGRAWHIDHIVPLASFQFESAEDPEFKAAWALSNLRPLWAVDNLTKSAKRLFLV